MAYEKSYIPTRLTEQKNHQTRISMISCIYLLRMDDNSFLLINSRSDVENKIKVLGEINKNHLSEISNIASQIFYHERDFNWIEDSIRQGIFLESNIKQLMNNHPKPLYLNSLLMIQGYSTRDKNIGLIDYFSYSLKKYEIFRDDLNLRLKSLWHNFTNSDKNFDWLQGENSEETRDFLWKNLNEKHSDLVGSHSKFRNHDELMIFFDQLSIDQGRKNEIVKKIENQWKRKLKSKEITDRRQFNVTLPNSTMEAIEKLKKKYSLSNTKIAQIVFDSEAQDNYHLNKKSNYTKHMLNTQSFGTNSGEQLSPKLVENNNTSTSILQNSLENAFPKSEGSS